MDYGRVMAALRRRRWLILLVVLGTTALTAFATTRMKREYQASATLMANEGALNPLPILRKQGTGDEPREELPEAQDKLKTIVEFLKSRGVVGEVIQKKDLKTTPELYDKQLDIQELTSRMLRVSYKDEDPKRAAEVVNTHVKIGVERYTSLRSQEARKQLDRVKHDQDVAKRALTYASNRLEQFKTSRKITSLDKQTEEMTKRANQLEADRTAAEAELRTVSAQVDNAEVALARMPATKTTEKNITQTEVLEKLKLDRNELAKTLEKLKAQYTEDHPAVQRAQQELDRAETRLKDEQSRLTTVKEVVPNPDREVLATTLRDLRRTRDGLSAKVRSLTARSSGLQAEVAQQAGLDVELNLLNQQYTLAEQRLNGLTLRQQQLEMAMGMLDRGESIGTVDRAGGVNPPADLSRGRTLKLSALAFVMSLAVCLALSIAMEMSDRRVHSVEDVEVLTQLPVVSVIRQLPGRASQGSLCLTAERDPASHLAESYHFLANHVLRHTLQRESTVLMAATARPGQGATTALSNLAVALARAGRQVILVEADLRRPFLHEAYGCGSKPGLTDVLQERVSVDDALYPTPVKNLRLMPSGSTVPDPWSLLWQPSMGLTVQALREKVDYVIFNVPSATVFADALCVAPHVDGAIMVMRTSEMPNGAEQKVQQWLEEVQVPVMGVVLNGVPSKQMDTFEFHRSYTARRADTTPPALNAPASPAVRQAASS